MQSVCVHCLLLTACYLSVSQSLCHVPLPMLVALRSRTRMPLMRCSICLAARREACAMRWSSRC